MNKAADIKSVTKGGSMNLATTLIVSGIGLYVKEITTKGENYFGTIIGADEKSGYYVVRFDCNGEIKTVIAKEKKPRNSEGKIGKSVMIGYDSMFPDRCSLINEKDSILLVLAGIALLFIGAVL